MCARSSHFGSIYVANLSARQTQFRSYDVVYTELYHTGLRVYGCCQTNANPSQFTAKPVNGIVRLNEVGRSNSPNPITDWTKFVILLGK